MTYQDRQHPTKWRVYAIYTGWTNDEELYDLVGEYDDRDQAQQSFQSVLKNRDPEDGSLIRDDLINAELVPPSNPKGEKEPGQSVQALQLALQEQKIRLQELKQMRKASIQAADLHVTAMLDDIIWAFGEEAHDTEGQYMKATQGNILVRHRSFLKTFEVYQRQSRFSARGQHERRQEILHPWRVGSHSPFMGRPGQVQTRSCAN